MLHARGEPRGRPNGDTTRITTHSSTEATPDLRRDLRLANALFINIGTTLASTLFMVPAGILPASGSAWLSTLVWVGAGLFSWCGALGIMAAGIPFYFYWRRGGGIRT